MGILQVREGLFAEAALGFLDVTPASRRGLKRTCRDNDCGARFYDLNKTTITCPVCGAGFTAPPLPKVREVAFKSVSPQRPFVRAFGGLGRPTAPLPASDEDTSDGDEIVDEGGPFVTGYTTIALMSITGAVLGRRSRSKA